MSQTNTPAPGDNQALINAMKDLHTPSRQKITSEHDVLVVPRGMEVQSLKPFLREYAERPERREGTATLFSLDSFIAWVNRHKGSTSVVFSSNSATEPSVTAVIDYNDFGEEHPADGSEARFRRHRGVYKFPLSKAWQAWAKVEGRMMPQAEFAAFLEDRIGDVLVPPKTGASEADEKLLDTIGSFGGVPAGPTRLLELARGLQIHEESKVRNVQNLNTGEVQITYETEHRNSAGEPLSIPNAFVIGIPVFELGAAYRIPVRLRYRRQEGAIIWSVSRYRPELVFDHAFDEAVQKVRAETELPLFLGIPEPAA